MKIKYEFIDGEVVEVEVPEELAREMLEMERKEKNNNQTETRRHVSYSNFNDKCESLGNNDFDLESVIIKKFLSKKINSVIKLLEPQQQKLIEEIFYKNREMTEIAKEEGVSLTAIQNRVLKILTRLKKFL